MKPIVIGIIVICVILYSWMIPIISRKYEAKSSLTGFWEADRDFCNESELKVLSIFIGDPDSSGKLPCYILLIQDDDEVLINERTNINLRPKWCSNNLYDRKAPWEYDITLSKMESSAFALKQSMKHYATANKIIMYKKDTVYAVLYKNPVLSELNDINTKSKSAVRDTIEKCNGNSADCETL